MSYYGIGVSRQTTRRRKQKYSINEAESIGDQRVALFMVVALVLACIAIGRGLQVPKKTIVTKHNGGDTGTRVLALPRTIEQQLSPKSKAGLADAGAMDAASSQETVTASDSNNLLQSHTGRAVADPGLDENALN